MENLHYWRLFTTLLPSKCGVYKLLQLHWLKDLNLQGRKHPFNSTEESFLKGVVTLQFLEVLNRQPIGVQ